VAIRFYEASSVGWASARRLKTDGSWRNRKSPAPVSESLLSQHDMYRQNFLHAFAEILNYRNGLDSRPGFYSVGLILPTITGRRSPLEFIVVPFVSVV
jgi:hypothetical protein